MLGSSPGGLPGSRPVQTRPKAASASVPYIGSVVGGDGDDADEESDASVYKMAMAKNAVAASRPKGAGGNDWKAAAKWLTSVGALPEVDSASSRGAPSCLDLILYLKDGTALCQAVNAIKTKTIPGERYKV